MSKPRPHSGSDQRGRVLIIYASAQEHARVIANAVAARIRAHGIVAEVGDAACSMMPPPQDYDAVVLGVPIELGPANLRITSYIDEHREALCAVPAALFTISTSGAARDQDPGGFLAQFVRATRWQPDFAAAFAGGEPLPREGWLVRLIGRGRDWQQIEAVRTDWVDVDRFADRIATELARAAVSAERTEPRIADEPVAMPHATDQELSRFESEGGPPGAAPVARR